MASSSPLINILVTQPEAELEKLASENLRENGEIKAALARNEVEGRLIKEALAKKSKGSSRRAGRRSDTRPRVLEALRQAARPLSAAEVRQELEINGSGPKGGSVHNMLSRLVEEGEIKKEDGLFVYSSSSDFSPENDKENPEYDSGFVDNTSGTGNGQNLEGQEIGF